MTTPLPPPTPNRAADLLLLSLAVAVLYLLTGSHAPFGSSFRYAEAAREMVALGDWVVPHLGYVAYAEKPILVYWLGAAAQRLLGDGWLAAQLPSALASLVSVLVVYDLGRRLRDRRFGLVAALLLLTSMQFLGMVGTLTTDPLLAAATAVAWWGWWRWQERGRRGFPWALWAALGVGLLAKGPVAVAIAGGALAAYHLLADGWGGAWRALRALAPLRGGALALAINLPWTLALWWRDPRLVEFFYLRMNLAAFVDGSINHPGPWWYYLPVLAGLTAPFTFIALPALGAGLWTALRGALPRLGAVDWPQGARPFLALAVLAPLVFLSLSASKLGSYLLPLLPPLVLLLLDHLWERQESHRRWWTGLIVAKIMVLQIALVCAPWVVIALEEAQEAGGPLVLNLIWRQVRIDQAKDVVLHGIDWSDLPLAQAALVVLVAGLLWGLVAAVGGRLIRALLVIGAAFAGAAAIVMPRIDGLIPDLDGRRLAAIARQQAAPGDLAVVSEELVQRYELTWTMGRRLAILGHARELGMGHAIEALPADAPLPRAPYEVDAAAFPGHPWLLDRERLAAAWGGERRVWLFARHRTIESLRAAGLAVVPIASTPAMALVSDRPAAGG